MCGFTGYLSSGQIDQSNSPKIIREMTNSLYHRGPDSEGFWSDSSDGISLGFRRLAILDTSSNGNQPMKSSNGQYVLVFNGEIYNHLALRKEIDALYSEKKIWFSGSDTETILSGFEIWGIKETIQKCIGMFSFAVWCKKRKVLTLGRDRLGEKPLYYGWQESNQERLFFFGSELKSFKKHPQFIGEINRGALSSFIRYSYIPAPSSIYEGIFKLLPGNILEVSLAEPKPIIIKYWAAEDIAIKTEERFNFRNDQEAIDSLETILMKSVNQQMIADVPIGAFLSGGIDSSLIVSLMQAQSDQKVKTFTIGFNHDTYNEAAHAKAVANHLNTDHSELYIDSNDLLEVIPKLAKLYDEPFSDSSQIPTYLISKFAKQNVTVSLSGDGGDELFCGYNRYQITNQYWPKLKATPNLLKKIISRSILGISPSKIDALYNFLIKNQRYSNFGEKVHKGSRVLGSKDISELYLGMTSAYFDPNSIVHEGIESNTFLDYSTNYLKDLDDLSLMMMLDLLTYLPDDILTKVDRAAMGVSLETRVPFLNHEVVEFALRLPLKYKLRNNQTKWLLRQILDRHVPMELIDRPKSGFAIPIGIWLKSSLKDWAEDLLDERTMTNQGFLNVKTIRERWSQHLSGNRNWEHFLWNILMFQSWLRETNE
ncbi:MAG: asparagine synthase (glutamine-hydrolyzing) [Euryarchaeota archaeon]|nr:asparagine synthase (glutamine-hydrolyzing) [Euryarchaeota archaeon]|tara:strand:+ start:7310 stop:9268 length:1959 start_codon:yes stop_codon:yes gene_type:complete